MELMHYYPWNSVFYFVSVFVKHTFSTPGVQELILYETDFLGKVTDAIVLLIWMVEQHFISCILLRHAILPNRMIMRIQFRKGYVWHLIGD